MHILNLSLLLVLPASILAAAVNRVVYVPGYSNVANNTSSNLKRNPGGSIVWGDDDTSQDACDSDSTPEKTGGSEFLKSDCADIIRLNNRTGRYTVKDYLFSQWAILNVKGTCSLAVSRKNLTFNDFE